MLENGIFVRDFGTRLEEIDLGNSGNTMPHILKDLICLSFPLFPFFLFFLGGGGTTFCESFLSSLL